MVPAFNEGDKIRDTIRGLPALVDHVIVVDDGSRDDTAAVAQGVGAAGDAIVEVQVHVENRGVGAAICTGYRRALAIGVDLVAVMAGDGQMDPADLPALLTPLVQGAADYAKGNRLAWPGGWRQMPAVRLAGGVALSWLTRVATGYGQVFDSQCGYTAISRQTLQALVPERLYPRYGYPNDLLGRLADLGARVVDVPVRPIYGAAWRSGLRPSRVALPVAAILLRALVRRLGRGLGGSHSKAPSCESGS